MLLRNNEIGTMLTNKTLGNRKIKVQWKDLGRGNNWRGQGKLLFCKIFVSYCFVKCFQSRTY